MLLTLDSLHRNRPIHSFSLLLTKLMVDLLKSCLTGALVKNSFLRGHRLRALRHQSVFAGGILKTCSILVLLCRISPVEQIPAFILAHSWICCAALGSYVLLLELLFCQLVLIPI